MQFNRCDLNNTTGLGQNINKILDIVNGEHSSEQFANSRYTSPVRTRWRSMFIDVYWRHFEYDAFCANANHIKGGQILLQEKKRRKPQEVDESLLFQNSQFFTSKVNLLFCVAVFFKRKPCAEPLCVDLLFRHRNIACVLRSCWIFGFNLRMFETKTILLN